MYMRFEYPFGTRPAAAHFGSSGCPASPHGVLDQAICRLSEASNRHQVEAGELRAELGVLKEHISQQASLMQGKRQGKHQGIHQSVLLLLLVVKYPIKYSMM